MKKALLLGMLLGLGVLLAACGTSGGSTGGDSGSGGGDTSNKGQIVSFEASPIVHDLGDQVTFSWEVDNPQSLPCSLDVDDDGVAEDYHGVCPNTGSFTYTYPQAGDYTAKLYLGSQADPADTSSRSLSTMERDVTAFYYRLYVIKDCDAGLAGAGEFGWDLFINGVRLSSVDRNNAVAINDGEYVDLTRVAKSLTISKLSDTVSFTGTIYEFDNGSEIAQPFSVVFGSDDRWGIQEPGHVWTRRFNISETCSFELSVAVRSP